MIVFLLVTVDILTTVRQYNDDGDDALATARRSDSFAFMTSRRTCSSRQW